MLSYAYGKYGAVKTVVGMHNLQTPVRFRAPQHETKNAGFTPVFFVLFEFEKGCRACYVNKRAGVAQLVRAEDS